MKLLSLSLFSAFVTVACLQTPGLEEPLVDYCAIGHTISSCRAIKVNDTYDIPTDLLEGFIAVSPQDLAKLKNHHDAIHTELNQCKNR